MQHLQTAANSISSTDNHSSDFSSGITSPIMSGTFFIHGFLFFFQHPFKQSCLFFFGLNQENCTVAQFKANTEINNFAFELPLQWNSLSLTCVHHCQASFGTRDRKKENIDIFSALQKFD